MIKVIAGKLLRDTEFIGKMDPYVTVEYRGNKHKTCVIQGGGKKPIWNDKFELEVMSMGDDIKFSCYDEDLWSQDLIGETSIRIAHLCDIKGTRKWLPLKFDKKKSGMVLLETKYTPPLELWPEDNFLTTASNNIFSSNVNHSRNISPPTLGIHPLNYDGGRYSIYSQNA